MIFDDEIPGYGLKVTAAGQRTLFLQYRSPVERPKRRRFNIGQLGTTVTLPPGASVILTAARGRKAARMLRGLVEAARDPFLERRNENRREELAIRAESARKAGARSVGTVVEEFLQDARERNLKPGTVAEWKRLLGKHVVPIIGDRPINEIGKDDALAVKRALPKGRLILANRVQQVCRSLVNFAEDDRAGRANPFVTGKRGAQRWYPEHLTRQPLTREELARLFAELDAVAGPDRGDATDAIRFLALSGWRKSEALGLRWDAIDFSTGDVLLTETKTGRSARALSPEALALLQAIPQRGPFVFPNPYTATQHRRGVTRTWIKVRAAAGITKPLHALRHTVGSIALSEGVPLATVGAILGQKDPKTTLRYAQTEREAARAAAAIVGAAIARSTAPAAVTPIGRSKLAKAK